MGTCKESQFGGSYLRGSWQQITNAGSWDGNLRLYANSNSRDRTPCLASTQFASFSFANLQPLACVRGDRGSSFVIEVGLGFVSCVARVEIRLRRPST